MGAEVDVLPASIGHVLFLNPPSKHIIYRGIVCTWISKAKYLWYPFDFILLSAFIPENTKISYLNALGQDLATERIAEFIIENKITHVIIALSSIEWENDFNCLKSIRKQFPELEISVLGDIFLELYFVKQVLPLSVVIIRHPLDIQIAEYFRSGRITTPSLLRDIECADAGLPPVQIPTRVDFPLPRHEVFFQKNHRSPFDKYKRSSFVNISWGCPFSCSYCSYASSLLPFVHKSAQSVIDELYFLQRSRIKEVFFADLNFGFPVDVCREILETMIRDKLRFSWHCYYNPGTLQTDFLKLMRAAGCHTVIIGVESPDIDLAQFKRNVTQQNIQDTIAACHKLDMEVCGDFIIGLNDSSEDSKQLAHYAINLKLDYASFNMYTPLLGSPVRDQKIKNGELREGEWGFDSTGSGKSFCDASRIRAQCVRMFYGRPLYLLQRLLSVETIDELFIKMEEVANIY